VIQEGCDISVHAPIIQNQWGYRFPTKFKVQTMTTSRVKSLS